MKNMPKVDIMPLSRIIWKKGHEDKAGLINQLAREYYEAELLTVAQKLRDCTTLQIPSENFVEHYENLTKKGLVFLPIKKVKQVFGFAHKFYDLVPGEPYNVYGAVSHSLDKAQEFVQASNKEKIDHKKIGRLLGYPVCCIDFFIKYWLAGEWDPIFLQAKRTKGAKVIKENVVQVKAPARTNVALRYFGLRPVPHLPCSFSCAKSQKFSEMFLRLMPSQDQLLKILSTPFEWNSLKGVAIIDTPWFQGVVNSMSWEDDNPRIVKFGLDA